MATQKILDALTPVIGKSKKVVIDKWEEVARSIGWDGRGARLYLDSVGK